MRKRVSRILAVTLATAVTVTAMPSEAEAAFRSFDSVPKAVSQAISQAASQKEIRYFPVTLYDYDQDMINQAVYQVEYLKLFIYRKTRQKIRTAEFFGVSIFRMVLPAAAMPPGIPGPVC